MKDKLFVFRCRFPDTLGYISQGIYAKTYKTAVYKLLKYYAPLDYFLVPDISKNRG